MGKKKFRLEPSFMNVLAKIRVSSKSPTGRIPHLAGMGLHFSTFPLSPLTDGIIYNTVHEAFHKLLGSKF